MAFMKEEELGEDELYYCSKCKKHQLAVKKLDIWTLPPILVSLTSAVLFPTSIFDHFVHPTGQWKFLLSAFIIFIDATYPVFIIYTILI